MSATTATTTTTTTNTNTTQFRRPNLKLSRFNPKPYKPTSPFSSPTFPNSELAFVLRKKCLLRRNSVLSRRTMFELVKASAFRNGNNGDEGIKTVEQEAFVDGSSELRSGSAPNRLESILNRLSKWVVSALFAGVILWRHDGEAVWAAMGSVMNAILSIVLKRLINQERPASTLKSDPGMPSSHSQSIFFIVTFSILSIVEGLGINDFTLATSGLALAFGSYLSWLRVSQQLHTVSQVVVGAVVGLVFAILWYWSWNAFVLQAFVSFLWVRIIVILGAAAFCFGFVIFVFKNWF